MSGDREGSSLSATGWPFHASHGSPILELDSQGEIVAVDVQRDVDVLRVQIGTGWITKTRDFSTGQDQATNGVRIARSAFQAVPQVDCAQFVLVGPFDAIVAHRDEGDLIG
jgi:hypothetical protein